MAAVVTITKTTNVDVSVRIINPTGTGQATIALTDLALDTETAASTLEVSIDRVFGSVETDATITITRNSDSQLFAVTGIDPDSDVIRENNTQKTHPIVVDFSGAGMLLMRLKKVSGYANHLQPEKFSIYDDESTADA